MNRFIKNCLFMRPVLFDVSIRDGIQGADPLNYPTAMKLDILSSIHRRHSPSKIEIGAFVSPKVLPIMSDTAKIFESIPSIIERVNAPDIYALVPNKVGLMKAIECGIKNFSFITSVSNAFQVKNTGKNLLHKKMELQEMMRYIADMDTRVKTKLYISCMNECPVTGILDNDFIIHEILSSYGREDTDFDEICISDTMGTLKGRDFEYIVDGLLRFGIPASKLSIHLHVSKENEREARKILFACFKRNIIQFDVSVLSDGGCSVTMDREQLKPNMTYEFFYDTFDEYKEHLLYSFSDRLK